MLSAKVVARVRWHRRRRTSPTPRAVQAIVAGMPALPCKHGHKHLVHVASTNRFGEPPLAKTRGVRENRTPPGAAGRTTVPQSFVGSLRQRALLGKEVLPRRDEGQGHARGPWIRRGTAAQWRTERVCERDFVTAPRSGAVVRPEEHLLEARVRLRVLALRGHGEAIDVRHDGSRPQLLHVVVVLAVVRCEGVLLGLEVVRVALHHPHVRAVVVVGHVAQRRFRQALAPVFLIAASVQVVVVEGVVSEAKLGLRRRSAPRVLGAGAATTQS